MSVAEWAAASREGPRAVLRRPTVQPGDAHRLDVECRDRTFARGFHHEFADAGKRGLALVAGEGLAGGKVDRQVPTADAPNESERIRRAKQCPSGPAPILRIGACRRRTRDRRSFRADGAQAHAAENAEARPKPKHQAARRPQPQFDGRILAARPRRRPQGAPPLLRVDDPHRQRRDAHVAENRFGLLLDEERRRKRTVLEDGRGAVGRRQPISQLRACSRTPVDL